MYSKIKIFGHPVHPMLVPFPIAFYTATLICAIVYGAQGDPFWFRAAYAANVAGVIMALVAGTFGFIDFLGIPSGTHAKRHGYQHLVFNSGALLLFALNIWLNSGQWDAAAPVIRFGILLPLIGVLFMLAAGYLGWTLVQTDHVGVETITPEERYAETSRTTRPR